MSYAVDKAIFLRDYQGRARRATDGEAEEAWRVYYLGHLCGTFGNTVEIAEAEYLRREGKPVMLPNGKKMSLPGGHPHELVLEVTLYSTAAQVVCAGALLESRAEKRTIEVVSSAAGRLYRMGEGAPFVQEILRSTGERHVTHFGFSELDAIVRRMSDDPDEFSRRAAADPKTDYLDVMPRAAVLARWGPKGDRVSRRL